VKLLLRLRDWEVEEVGYFLLLSMDLEYISKDVYKKFESEYEVVSKMLNGLIKSLKT
jgi:four helix bundle protein